MSFLDRFKLQPRWKNADPAVRAAAVAELPRDEESLAILRELARDDADPRVRRAAGGRLSLVEDVVQLARAERDEELRQAYVERLVTLAIAPADTDASAALALEGIDDQKHFAAIARSSPHDTVRAAALGRIHDPKLLSGVARQAGDPQTAADAVARIADGAELLNIAVKTDHKDAGVSALERALEAGGTGDDIRALLDGVVNRAKNKAVARRARAIIQAMDEEEAARRAALEQWQQRVAGLVARAEALAAHPAIEGAQAQLDDAEEQWRTVTGAGAFQLDPDTSARFSSLVAQTRAEHERMAREEEEQRAAAERRAQRLAAQDALCAHVAAVQGDDVQDQLARARAEWEGLRAVDDQAPEPDLEARFASACARAEERYRRREELAQAAARLDELSRSAEQLAAQDPFNDAVWAAAVREFQTLRTAVEPLNDEVAQRFAGAEAAVRQRAEERRAAAERTLRQQVQRVEQLIERAMKRATAEDLTLREAERISKDLKIAVETPPLDLPRAEQQALIDRLRVAHGELSPKLHELREMDEWKRFANAAVQEELIARSEALRAKYPFDRPDELTSEQLDEAAKELHLIQERWKQAADAPRAQAQALWHRYRQAADPVQAHVREFYAKRALERNANLAQKMALIERAEALANSSDWMKTAEEFKKLQAEWQAIGAVPRQESRESWKRFREACDRFFTRRNADLALRKETWAANLARKEALCARAEELCSSMNWESAASEMRRLQAEWKTIGPVRKNKSEAIWQRFRTAADTFFDRYKRRDQIELETKQADREALVTEIETLADTAAGSEPQAVLDQVRSLRTRWNQSTPVVRQGADPLSGRFMTAIERLIIGTPDAFRGTELDVEANRERMSKLVAKVEGLLNAAPPAPANSSEALATMLREALASNTIGGRGGEESKWKAMAEDVRQAQASWSRLGPVPGETGQELSDRFHKACSRFFEQYRRKVPPADTRRGKPVGAR